MTRWLSAMSFTKGGGSERVKVKAAKLRQEQNQTGGGERTCPPLTKIEERLLAVMGEKGLIGDNVKELGVASVNNLSKLI